MELWYTVEELSKETNRWEYRNSACVRSDAEQEAESLSQKRSSKVRVVEHNSQTVYLCGSLVK